MSDTVQIIVSGASDDLVEVTGPCYAMGRPSDVGEYCHESIGPIDRRPPHRFLLLDAYRHPIAAVYAMYDGAWSFALCGVNRDGYREQTLPDDVTAVVRQSDETAYSAELVIAAPEGTRFGEEDDSR